MCKARLDGDNSEFFTGTTTAGWRDFQLVIGSIALLLVYGIYEWVFALFNAATLSILLITLGLLLVQFRLMAVWWSRSVSTKPSKD
jgi:dolichyl-phosphate-mannose--protein O-mannosyl transferase